MTHSTASPDRKSIVQRAIRFANWLKQPVIPANQHKQTYVSKWQLLTLEESLEKLTPRRFWGDYTGIAIVQGGGAGKLGSIDCDSREFLAEVFALNPWATKTLFSWANRGGNIHFRPTGQIPEKAKLWRYTKARERVELGEWRWTGNYVVIDGQHEAGKRYQHNGKEPLEVPWSEVRFPKGVHPFNPNDEDVVGTEIQRYKDTEDTDDVIEGGECAPTPLSCVPSLEAAVTLSTPTKPRQTATTMFKFCRALKNLEAQRGSPFTPSELMSAFNKWHEAAAPNLRHSRDHYFLEFMDRYKRTKYALGVNLLLQRAIERIAITQPPPEAAQFHDEKIRRLISLLYCLHLESAGKPFYLPTRTGAKALGGMDHNDVATYLRAFRAMQIIKEVEKGTTNKAPRIIWAGHPDAS